jgi:hypothetical protein
MNRVLMILLLSIFLVAIAGGNLHRTNSIQWGDNFRERNNVSLEKVSPMATPTSGGLVAEFPWAGMVDDQGAQSMFIR